MISLVRTDSSWTWLYPDNLLFQVEGFQEHSLLEYHKNSYQKKWRNMGTYEFFYENKFFLEVTGTLQFT